MIRFSSACRQLSVSVSVPARSKPCPRSMRLQNFDAQYQQQRNTSSLSSENPWKVLGVPRNSCEETVRTAFMRLALRYHPDTSNGDTGDDFARIREAFERIRDNARSGSNHGKNKSWLTEEVFNVFFEEHTGLRMDAATRREVMISYREGAVQKCENENGVPSSCVAYSFYLGGRRIFHEEALLQQERNPSYDFAPIMFANAKEEEFLNVNIS
eukprot:CAMPEP_0170784518 /NCGR_PEP_ID=MMETSP0733-20121128/16239_1 /TAXON_ID=186038 /ORGANISM="Fragilariopsis kerguelensis, Strain L26-C5" /LENGTH=212 /DNA_ID=CAMNT_0011129557 /DNA_START=255 /DNA_END=892 /DNA_ORIENTATION=+